MNLHRVRCTLDPARASRIRSLYGQAGLHEDLRNRLARVTGLPTVLAAQDPTDHRRACLVVRGGPPAVGAGDDLLRVDAVEPVDAPHLPTPKEAAAARTWDPGLHPAERWTIDRALAVEDDPGHLRGLARSLEPHFPVAASHLRARATEVDRTRPGYRPTRRLLGAAPSGPVDVAPLRQNLLALARSESVDPSLLEAEVRRVACILCESPPDTAAVLSGFPGPVLALGHAVVRDVGPETRVVDAAAMRQACPPTGHEGYVSPGALWLAEAAGRPRGSGVADPARAEALMKRLADDIRASERDPALGRAILRARGAMEAAQREIERRRWVEWYVRESRDA